ncbi:TIGR00659 family protein [Alteribacillus persepolensis]|uniref:TIGR00659 family protein n=1 Tax=Alteribacillus persepolensis TaxID=568899 RepID=A0A1G8E411_9BACI|nr:LrgB family protein [Alteribacillus persepolensis]SDH64682.1 TIGR00659 family protein [Alteribacillus persepolensis]
MGEWLIIILSIAGTIIVYGAARKLYMRFSYPFTLPIVTGTAAIILFLMSTGISYDTYMSGGQWIEHLLGPAVVALAYPLYKQRSMLKTYFWPITMSVSIGAVVGVFSGYYMSLLAGLENELIASVLPKSVTTPVAMELAAVINGPPPLAAVFVMVAGIGGVLTAPLLYKYFGIQHVLARGISIGSASHAIGTAKALESSEKEGAASTVAMTISAVIVSIIIPLSASWLF